MNVNNMQKRPDADTVGGVFIMLCIRNKVWVLI